MQGEPQEFVRWELVFHADGKSGWSWRRLRIDESIASASEPFPTFGKAINDALKYGFSPRTHSWVVKNYDWTTCFYPGGRSITTGPHDQVIQRPVEPGPSSPYQNNGSHRRSAGNEQSNS
jgi:hypothetical protein